jgi:hypothetical protein
MLSAFGRALRLGNRKRRQNNAFSLGRFPPTRSVSSGHASHRSVSDEKAIFAGADDDLLAVVDLSGEDQFGQRILHIFLNYPLQWPRAIGWIIAFAGQPRAGLGLEFKRDLAIH